MHLYDTSSVYHVISVRKSHDRVKAIFPINGLSSLVEKIKEVQAKCFMIILTIQ